MAAGGKIRRAEIPWRELPGLRLDEAAAVIGVGRKGVEGLIERGELRQTRIGPVRLVLTASIRELFGEQEGPTVPSKSPQAAHRAGAQAFLKEVSVR